MTWASAVTCTSAATGAAAGDSNRAQHTAKRDRQAKCAGMLLGTQIQAAVALLVIIIVELRHCRSPDRASHADKVDKQARRARARLTVAAKIACAVVGDSGVVALLLLGPFRALPACASSTKLDTCTELNM